MWGRFTRQYTWQQLHALYRLSVPTAIPNFQPQYNVCPTDPADVVVPNEGARELVQMRWGLVPFWWDKTLKELRLSTFNARVETVATKQFLTMQGIQLAARGGIDAKSLRAQARFVVERLKSR
jgi:putative SOS response-associated peptidase YedK